MDLWIGRPRLELNVGAWVPESGLIATALRLHPNLSPVPNEQAAASIHRLHGQNSRIFDQRDLR